MTFVYSSSPFSSPPMARRAIVACLGCKRFRSPIARLEAVRSSKMPHAAFRNRTGHDCDRSLVGNAINGCRWPRQGFERRIPGPFGNALNNRVANICLPSDAMTGNTSRVPSGEIATVVNWPAVASGLRSSAISWLHDVLQVLPEVGFDLVLSSNAVFVKNCSIGPNIKRLQTLFSTAIRIRGLFKASA